MCTEKEWKQEVEQRGVGDLSDPRNHGWAIRANGEQGQSSLTERTYVEDQHRCAGQKTLTPT